jgi:fucose permease
MSARLELVPATASAAFACGTVLALMGSIRVPLAKRLGVTESRANALGLALSVSLVPALFLSGLAIDRWGVAWVLTGSALLTAVSVATLTLGRNWGVSTVALGLVGVGCGGLLTASNVLMPAALVPEHPAASANLGNVFFVLGLLLAPTSAEVLIRRSGFRRTLGLTALFCLVPAVAAAFVSEDAFPGPTHPNLERAFADPLLWVAGLTFLLYGPLEGMVGGWASSYLTDLGLSERRVGWLVPAFWLSFLAGRLVTALLLLRGALPHWSEGLLILLAALTIGVALGNLASTTHRAQGVWGLLLVGFLMGPIFPTLVGGLFRHFPDEPGTALGTVTALGSLGSLFLVPLIGVYARRTTVTKALRIPTVVALSLTAAALVLALCL